MPSQGKSEGSDGCDWPSNLTQIGLKSSITQPVWPYNLMNDLEKHKTLYIISNPLVKSNWSYSPEMLNSGKNWWFFVPHDLDIWWMILKNNRATLLYYIKLCAAFQSHWHIQTEVNSPQTLNSDQNWWFFCHGVWRMTLQNNRAPLLYHVRLCASFQIHWWS